ncbi:MAG: hypothetical protein CV087_07505 [Candidatus Brocadia sp. WS118]|nr:MAG: hypothetical protein CV087_07505 [Candidatus Brocadia sp. WS118]
MDHLEIFFGVLSLLATMSLFFTGLAYKIFSTSIKELRNSIEKLEQSLIEQRHINERLEMRINANSVSIAKIETLKELLEKMEKRLERIQDAVFDK